MINGSDWLLSGYTNQLSWTNYFKSHGRYLMWDKYNFSGHPTVTSSGGGMVYPMNILYIIFPVHLGLTILYIIHTFLAGLGMWLLLKEYKLNNSAACLGAIAFMFAGQLISTTQAGHLARMNGAVFLPFAFFFLHKALKTLRLGDFVIFGGITGLFMLAGQVQVTYWGMIGITSYFLFELLRRMKKDGRKNTLKTGGYFLIGLLVLSLIISIKLLPPALSLGTGARGATRGYVYSTSWSLPTSELFDLFIPHFSGILGNYWGENPFKLNTIYLGILPLILIGFSFLYKEKRHLVKFFATFSAITLLLALGRNTPVFRIYYYLVPMAKKFRAPDMFFFLTTFGICVLSGIGAEYLLTFIKKKNEKEKKTAKTYLTVTAGIVFMSALILTIGDESILNWMKHHFAVNLIELMDRGTIQNKIYLMSMNFPNIKKSLWISTILFIINTGLLYSFLERKIDIKIVIPILVLILIADVWAIDKKYLSSVNSPEKYFAADGVTKLIKQDKGLFRVFPFYYEGRSRNGYLQYHGIENIGGYGPNPPSRYQHFIGAGRSVMFNPQNLILHPHMISMLNVKYIIGPRLPEDLSSYDENVKRNIQLIREFYSNFEIAYQGMQYQVLRNKNSQPRVSLFYEYSIVSSAEEALNKILSPDFKVGKDLILEKNVPFPPTNGSGSVEIRKYGTNEKVFTVKTDKPAFLIIRENFNPDWECYIDNKKEKIYLANYLFYGVFIPEGEHSIQFVYNSKPFILSCWLSFTGLMIFLTILGFSLYPRKSS